MENPNTQPLDPSTRNGYGARRHVKATKNAPLQSGTTSLDADDEVGKSGGDDPNAFRCRRARENIAQSETILSQSVLSLVAYLPR